MDRITTAEIHELEECYARNRRDEYLPVSVQRRLRQIRQLIAEVKMWRESAGSETE